MKKIALTLVCFTILEVISAQTFTEVNGAFPFNAFGLAPDSKISAADLNHPITDKDRITVSSDGHLQAKGQRLRIFGTNLSEFPRNHKEADFAAQALANQGYNCIRFHHTDSDWANCFIKKDSNGNRILNTKKLDDFDYFFAQLKAHGIYSNLNLLTGRTYTTADGLKPEIMNVKDWKDRHSLGFWNEDGKKVQKQWAQTLLNHVNPYTGLSYIEDPAVAIVEINNENGLLQAFLNKGLEEYNGEYWQDLEDQWNMWLKKQGHTYNSLAALYNSSTKTSAPLISGASYWNVERHEGAKAEVTNNGSTHTIKVEQNGKESWHIQMNCSKLSMEEGKVYTITFSAKATRPCQVDVSLMQAHSPWKNAGFSSRIDLTTNWKEFTFTVSGISTDPNLRLNFGNMGLSAGTTFSYKDIKINEGGTLIQVKKGAEYSSSNPTVAMPHHPEYISMPKDLKQLVLTFLWETEDAYWKEMSDYIRYTLGSKALLMGTIVGCSTVNLQSYFDIIDSHAYWNHPAFPVNSWDMNKYYVANRSLTKAGTDNTLTGIAKYRVYGKPFSCSEYDHPYPNQYQAEMYPMLAAYASFQDWDVLFTFCYTLPKTPGGQTEKISGFFDQGLTPVKSCAAPIAARIFRQFLVEPGKTALYVPVSIKTEKESLTKFSSWAIGETSVYGINKSLGVTSCIGVILPDNPQCSKVPANGQLITQNMSDLAGKKKSQVFSDTKELYWDQETGVFVVCNDNVMITVCDKDSVPPVLPAEWLTGKRLLPLTAYTDFSSVAAVKKANYYAGFAARWNGNKGEALSQYGKEKGTPAKFMRTRDLINLTTLPGLGIGPAYCQGIDGNIIFSGNAKGKFYYAGLDGNETGKPQTGNKFNFTPDSESLWFIVTY